MVSRLIGSSSPGQRKSISSVQRRSIRSKVQCKGRFSRVELLHPLHRSAAYPPENFRSRCSRFNALIQPGRVQLPHGNPPGHASLSIASHSAPLRSRLRRLFLPRFTCNGWQPYLNTFSVPDGPTFFQLEFPPAIFL